MTGEDSRLKIEAESAITLLTIDRPDKLNALDAGLVAALDEACRRIEANAATRVVILTGSGSKSFSAGGDISAWSASDPVAFGRNWVRDGHAVFDRLARLRQPVIAVLNGHTLGGGLELAACADYRIAEAHVRIGQPETSLGIIPGWSGTQRAVRRFGSQVVRRMAIFGEVFEANAALGLGLVDQVVESGQGLAAARALAERVIARGPLATEISKMAISAAEGEETERVIEALAGIAAASSPELATGLAAFRTKTTPKF